MGMDILKRGRRLRGSEGVRRLVRETRVTVDDFIYPLFIVEGDNVKNEISSMPDVYQISIDNMLRELEEVSRLKIPSVMLFGVPSAKDELASGAYCNNGIVQKAIREAKKEFPQLLIAADVCLCEYTSHGHCGVVENGKIINDESIKLLTKSALSFAEAGADIIAPSDMMDGRIGKIRKKLDKKGFEDKIIMAYSAKYSSAFYGPFRDAANSAPKFGDRKTYQMDYANVNEAIREIEQDIEEGCDIVMVKPAMAYMDVIKEASLRFDVPIAAYNVSGEYSMIKAGAKMGWIDERGVALETLTSIKRAGAKIIITYFAKQAAKWLENA
jgi:porphobilinogen synthase